MRKISVLRGAAISVNDKEMGKILVMAEALEKWDDEHKRIA
jgi:hypothetical protein